MSDSVIRPMVQPPPPPQLLRRMYGHSLNSSSPASLNTPRPTSISLPSRMAATMHQILPRSSIRRIRRLRRLETLRDLRRSILKALSSPTESRSHTPSLERSLSSYVTDRTQCLITTDPSVLSYARRSRLANVSSRHATTQVLGSLGTPTQPLSPTSFRAPSLIDLLWTVVCPRGFTAAVRSGDHFKNSSSTPMMSARSV